MSFIPLSPESHILQQSPYRKVDGNGNGQVRSFYKSKSTAAFRDLRTNVEQQQQQLDPVAFLLNQHQQDQSPSQPDIIRRDWSSCALAAQAASRRRPANYSDNYAYTSTLPAHHTNSQQQQQLSSSLVQLLRAYNLLNAQQSAQRLQQVGGVASVVAACMPPPGIGAVTGAAWYAVAYKVVNFAAINLGHARNASAPATGSASIATPNNGAST